MQPVLKAEIEHRVLDLVRAFAYAGGDEHQWSINVANAMDHIAVLSPIMFALASIYTHDNAKGVAALEELSAFVLKNYTPASQDGVKEIVDNIKFPNVQ